MKGKLEHMHKQADGVRVLQHDVVMHALRGDLAAVEDVTLVLEAQVAALRDAALAVASERRRLLGIPDEAL